MGVCESGTTHGFSGVRCPRDHLGLSHLLTVSNTAWSRPASRRTLSRSPQHGRRRLRASPHPCRNCSRRFGGIPRSRLASANTHAPASLGVHHLARANAAQCCTRYGYSGPLGPAREVPVARERSEANPQLRALSVAAHVGFGATPSITNPIRPMDAVVVFDRLQVHGRLRVGGIVIGDQHAAVVGDAQRLSPARIQRLTAQLWIPGPAACSPQADLGRGQRRQGSAWHDAEGAGRTRRVHAVAARGQRAP